MRDAGDAAPCPSMTSSSVRFNEAGVRDAGDEVYQTERDPVWWASTRPACETPEMLEGLLDLLLALLASTRPACETPEMVALGYRDLVSCRASTRPACETPEMYASMPSFRPRCR